MPVGLEIMSLIRTRRISATSPRRGQVSGAMPVALRVRNFRRTATRMTVSIGVAVLVVIATVMLALVSTVSPAVKLSADSTALIMGGTSVPTPDNVYIDAVRNQYIAPTHPGQDITYVAVTTPEEGWPLTGLLRLIGFAVGPQSVWGPGGAGWPDEPWWKLSGLFDLTYDQSFQAGVADLEQAMAAHGNDHLVIYGYSQGAIIANLEKQKLAEQYPPGTKAPDINFALSGDLNVPNGGIHARFPGLYVPIGWTFNGPEPTDTQFHTDVITRQYDGLADFPLYPLNLVADLNAVLGLAYVHLHDLDVSLPADPTTSKYYQGTHGDTSYYFFPTQDLPLFAPLRTLGVPESLIDVVEPFFKVLVELGYDRSIPPWEPTPARLIPPLNPVTVTSDLVKAIGEGINNALALTGSPPPLRIPAPDTTNSIDTLGTTGINAVDTNTTNIFGANTVGASGTNTTGGTNTTDTNTNTNTNTTDMNTTDINTTGTHTVGASGTHTTGTTGDNTTGINTFGGSGTHTVGASGGTHTTGATGINNTGATGTDTTGTNNVGTTSIKTTGINTLGGSGTHTVGASSTGTGNSSTGNSSTGTGNSSTGTG
jgi:hypothetical protein